jgi:phosphate uptake regulator
MVQKENYVLIKEISSVNHEEFMNTLRRIFISLVNISSDINDSIEGKNKVVLQRIIKMAGKKINKLCDFCFRIINKGGVVENKKSPQYYAIITVLEEIGDLLEEICKLSLKKELNVSVVKDINNLLENIYLLFCEYKKERLSEVYVLKNKLRDMKSDYKVQLCGLADNCSKLIAEIIALNM